jgi:hypothetical protein
MAYISNFLSQFFSKSHMNEVKAFLTIYKKLLAQPGKKLNCRNPPREDLGG